MSLSNTSTRYGALARSLHWLTALLILSAIGLGLYADNLPYDTSETLAAKAQIFSLHKTIGIAAFFVAAIRIVSALLQPKPAPVHPDRRLETFAAETVHWALYISMLAVPLTGWVHHAAVEGFAPILWPFGQGLPFVPKSETVSEIATAMHWLFSKLLIASVILHVAGAVKHAVIDRDGVMARMTRGTSAGQTGRAAHSPAPVLAALLIYLAGGVAAVSMTAQAPDAPVAESAAPASDVAESAAPESAVPTPQTPATATASSWQVTEGALAFTVQQMGAAVAGSLPNWTAEISFDETPVDGRHGHVTVKIDTTTLTLGSVTEQAKAADFFDVANHPGAVFEADILPAASGYAAQGTLTLRGVSVPVVLPFTLTLNGDSAQMTGALQLDRRDFGMGASYGDEKTVGFGVDVAVTLTAKRG
ncbi:MAG TPA: cytochrome [Gemmobacter sp.]|nr:MAG: cytochrome [Rhodobacteraceae bacterium GWF1_65_7]HBD91197.1 cytochrome [Gemmobacter sp.]